MGICTVSSLQLARRVVFISSRIPAIIWMYWLLEAYVCFRLILLVYLYKVLKHWYLTGKDWNAEEATESSFGARLGANFGTNASNIYCSFCSLLSRKHSSRLQSFSRSHSVLITIKGCLVSISYITLLTSDWSTGRVSLNAPSKNKATSCCWIG